MDTPSQIPDLVESTPVDRRIEALERELRYKVLEQRKLLLESLSVTLGGSTSVQNLNIEDPRFDDGEVWDEIGFRGRRFRGSLRRHPYPFSWEDLDCARSLGRWMADENEYAIGAQTNRQSYIVGAGITWRAVPKDAEAENEALTKRINDLLTEWADREGFAELQRELVWRSDRDGEAFIRLFRQTREPGGPAIRFVEPERIQSKPAPDPNEVLGVIHTPGDLRRPTGYRLDRKNIVRRLDPKGSIQVLHHKMNVGQNQTRGWPTMWAIRKNLVRAEKLLRNMSVVAALQAAIALIRKHRAATKSDVEAFLDSHRDLLTENTVTGNSTRHRKIEAGTIIDAGPGTDYDAPVSSVNAANNVEVLRADLRACAARLVMAEYMFSGDSSDANYASSLVAEAPVVKNFQALQACFARPLRQILRAVLEHEVNYHGLPANALTDYDLVGDFPSLIVRDQLQEAQRRQIMHGEGVMSTLTWRTLEGLDDATEERNHDQAEERGYTVARGAEEPAPEPENPTGEGGADQTGNTDDPESAADSNFESTLTEALQGGDFVGAVSQILRVYGPLIALDKQAALILELIGILNDETKPEGGRIRAAMQLITDRIRQDEEPVRDPEPDGDGSATATGIDGI